MFRVWIDTHDLSREPAVTPPDLRVEKDLYPITDFNILSHAILLAAVRPEHQTECNHHHDTAIDRPLWVASHVTAWQNVNSLQKEGAAREDQEDADDVQ